MYSDEEKIKIAKRATEMGVTNTIRHIKKEFDVRKGGGEVLAMAAARGILYDKY